MKQSEIRELVERLGITDPSDMPGMVVETTVLDLVSLWHDQITAGKWGGSEAELRSDVQELRQRFDVAFLVLLRKLPEIRSAIGNRK